MEDRSFLYELKAYLIYIKVVEKSSYLPIPKNNGTQSHRGIVSIIFQEWTDNRTFSYT